MDPTDALADLKQISPQITRAVIVANDGAVEASTLADADAAERMARSATALYEAALQATSDLGRPALAQVEVAMRDGSVFAVRDPQRMVCAVTDVDPTVGLIFYDLKTCLRSVGESQREDPFPAGEEATDGEA
jgi:predicted regulator of Ras-like GTPase activity (Roadblock/LC7/MglB family)